MRKPAGGRGGGEGVDGQLDTPVVFLKLCFLEREIDREREGERERERERERVQKATFKKPSLISV